MKTLLILCGGSEAVEAIKIAKSMGHKVFVCDGNINAPGKKLADQFIHASIYHPEEILEALERFEDKNLVNGIITVAADNPLSVSKAAKYLGLNSLTERAATLSTNKLKMKDVLKKSNILIPWYKGINSLEELKKVLNSRPSDYVLKPIDSRGSRGVIRINNILECENAFEYAIKYSDKGELILEEWIDGHQLSSESIVFNKKAHICGLADRNYDRLEELYPFVVEDGGETPSRFSSEELENKIDNLMTSICEIIGFEEGSIKGDLILSNDEIYLVEFATRLSGGSFSTFTIPQVYGYDLIKNVIKISLGEKPNLPPKPLEVKKYQCNRFCFIPEGIIHKISGLPSPDKKIIDFQLYVKEGDSIKKITNHTMRAGTVLTVTSSPEKSLNLAIQTIKDIKFEMR